MLVITGLVWLAFAVAFVVAHKLLKNMSTKLRDELERNIEEEKNNEKTIYQLPHEGQNGRKHPQEHGKDAQNR